MFVLTVKMKVIKDKQVEFEKLIHDFALEIHKNEPDNIVYNWHRKIDNPCELFFYEMYKDRMAWADTHMAKPYVKELGDVISNYVEGDLEMAEYELAESV